MITSGNTCSASECLINGLSPYLQVVTVGGTTCGKPVGGGAVGYGDQVYRLIMFKVVNARGKGDYYDGLPPTCAAPEDLTYGLGNPEEASLKAALYYIQHGRCPERGPATGSVEP